MTGLAAKLRRGRDLLRSVDETDFRGLSQSEMNDATTTFRRLRRDVDVISRFFDKAARDA